MNNPEDKSIHASSLFNKYVTEYESKFMNVELYKDSLNAFLNLIPGKNPKVLDVACGPGNVAKYLLDHNAGISIFGIDLSPNMIAAARRNNPTAQFEVMDCRTIATLKEKYDAVVCAFCFPYLSKQEVGDLINNIRSLLNDNGVIYISTMEADYSTSGLEAASTGDLVFMHYYMEADLIAELSQSGFAEFKISRVKTIMTNGKEVVDLSIIAKK